MTTGAEDSPARIPLLGDLLGRREAIGLGLVASMAIVGRTLSASGVKSPPPATLKGRSETGLPDSIDPKNAGQIAAAKGLVFGSCISARPLRSDAQYRFINRSQCNTLVHASAFQWHELQHRPDEAYRFADAEAIWRWGQQAGRPFRGHLLIDWAGLPDFYTSEIERLNATQAEAWLRAHVRNICRPWRGRFFQWNVVNEPVNGYVRRYGWYDKLGEEYIDIAFDEARKCDPDVPLSLNQNLIENDQWFQKRTRNSLLELTHRLQSRGVPLSSVGVEGHLLSGETLDATGMDGFYRDLAAMNLNFMITELDVNDLAFAEDMAVRDEDVAAMTRDFLDVALAQPRCEGIVCWGLLDRYNWLTKAERYARTDKARQRPAPFDMDGNPKPMWREMLKALRRAPGPGRHSVLPKTA